MAQYLSEDLRIRVIEAVKGDSIRHLGRMARLLLIVGFGTISDYQTPRSRSTTETALINTVQPSIVITAFNTHVARSS